MIVLIGASASGKTEIAKILIKNHGYEKMVTYTTRVKRPGEKDGIDYHFIDKTTFLKRKAAGFFLESSCYSNNYYGTAFKDASRNKVVIVDVNGANALYEKCAQKITIIFIKTPKAIRKSRMLARGDRETDIDKRLDIDDATFKESALTHIDTVIENIDQPLEGLAETIDHYYRSNVS